MIKVENAIKKINTQKLEEIIKNEKFFIVR
jgi:hypothetical protein